MLITMTRSVDAEIKRVTVIRPRRPLDAPQTIALREDVSMAWRVRKAVDNLSRKGLKMPVADRARRSKRRNNEDAAHHG